MEKYLLSCDWGSTVFRLRLVEMPEQQVVGEISSEDGVTRTFNAWKTNAADSGISRKQFFFDELKKQTTILAVKLAIKLDGIPIIISGMASSSIGMQEMPYAAMPFTVDGKGANVQVFDENADFPNKVILISGIRSEEDAMRGEETQLIGIAELLGLQKQDVTLILPGTHSKHLHIKGGKLVDFQTFMTGEVFSLLINHSILKDSVEINAATEFSEEDIAAFKKGLGKSSSANMLNSLFTVRTNQLFNKLNRKHNFFYLSGLLIGSEITHLRQKDGPLILCSASVLYELYKLALQEFGLLKQTTIISADMIHKATIAGQIILYKNIN